MKHLFQLALFKAFSKSYSHNKLLEYLGGKLLFYPK